MKLLQIDRSPIEEWDIYYPIEALDNRMMLMKQDANLVHCPFCGGSYFADRTCQTCGYILGTGIAVDPNTYSISVGDIVPLMALLFFAFFVFYKRISIRHKREGGSGTQ